MSVSNAEFQVVVALVDCLVVDLNAVKLENVELQKTKENQDKKIAAQAERILHCDLRVYDERKKANDISSDVVECKDVLKLAGESVLTVGGVAAVVFGGTLCAVPGGMLLGVPLVATGIASTATGGALLENTGSHMSKRNKIYKEAHAEELKISYNEANDLADGKEVQYIGEDKSTVRKIKIKGNEILANNPNLTVKWR